MCPPECDDGVQAKTPTAPRRNGHHDGEQHDRSDESEVQLVITADTTSGLPASQNLVRPPA
jgi:hypothetical protein